MKYGFQTRPSARIRPNRRHEQRPCILGALLPLAVPFLERQELSALGLIAALAISASVVDSSPFSTSGSLIVANAPPALRELIYRRLLQWGFSMVVLVPLVAWLVLVVPGWL